MAVVGDCDTGKMSVLNERLRAGAYRRVNVGCGDYPLDYYVNLDNDPTKPVDICARVPPLPFLDNSLYEIYAGHLLEHLEYEQSREFLRECFRCLMPRGRVGLVVPDIREVMRRWLTGSPDMVQIGEGEWWAINNLDDVCHLFLYSTVQSSLHRWAYDEETLGKAMTEAGFVNLRGIDRYRDSRLGVPAWYQVGLDGFKPCVLC